MLIFSHIRKCMQHKIMVPSLVTVCRYRVDGEWKNTEDENFRQQSIQLNIHGVYARLQRQSTLFFHIMNYDYSDMRAGIQPLAVDYAYGKVSLSVSRWRMNIHTYTHIHNLKCTWTSLHIGNDCARECVDSNFNQKTYNNLLLWDKENTYHSTLYTLQTTQYTSS